MVLLTKHTAKRLKERHIPLNWIEAAIASPDWTRRDPDPALTRSYKSIPEFGGRILRVVHRPEGPDVLVVTAHFDRNARP